LGATAGVAGPLCGEGSRGSGTLDICCIVILASGSVKQHLIKFSQLTLPLRFALAQLI